MLKDGSPAAFVEFSRPKQVHGLILHSPDGVLSASKLFFGFEGVLPAEESKEKSLYFQVAGDQLIEATGTFYVTVWYYDKGQGTIEVEYRSLGTKENRLARTERLFLGNSGIWQFNTFILPQAALDHFLPGENDFRILCPGVAMHRVAISRVPLGPTQQVTSQWFKQPTITPPAGYEFAVQLKPSEDDSFWQNAALLEDKMKLFQSWGARVVVDTVRAKKHPTLKELFDFSAYTSREADLSRLGMTWAPRVKIGNLRDLPKETADQLQRAVGTDRVAEGPMVSLWDPRLPEFYTKVLTDLRISVTPTRLPLLVLSFAGDWGPLYLSSESDAAEGWPDFWVGDPFAQKSFSAYVQQKYGDLKNCNRAWRTAFRNWNEALPTLTVNAAPMRRIDANTWYHRSLADLAGRIVNAAKRQFPNTRIVLEIGDNFQYGAADMRDFSELAAQLSCSLVLLNKNPLPTASYAWQWLATDCRRLGVPFGLRLNYAPDAETILSALYSLASERGTLLFLNEDDLVPEGAWKLFEATAPKLKLGQPRRPVAVVFPRTSVYSEGVTAMERYVRDLRELFAFDLIDEADLDKIPSSQYPLLFVPWGTLWASSSAETFRTWVRNGSSLIVRANEPLETLNGEVEWNEQLFAVRVERKGDRWIMTPRWSGYPEPDMDSMTPTSQRIVRLGAPGDSAYLSGDWGAPQAAAAARRYGFPFSNFRWLGEKGSMMLPLIPGRDYQLEIEGYLPENKQFQIAVNGKPLGTIQGSGAFVWKHPLSGAWKPVKKDVQIFLRGQTWNPGEVLGATETYRVGMAVSRVSVYPLGQNVGKGEDNMQLPDTPDFERSDFRGVWFRKVGRGATILAPSTQISEWGFMELLNAIVTEPKWLRTRYTFTLPPDGQVNKIYASPLAGSAVYLNMSEQPVAVGENKRGSLRFIIPPRTIDYKNY